MGFPTEPIGENDLFNLADFVLESTMSIGTQD